VVGRRDGFLLGLFALELGAALVEPLAYPGQSGAEPTEPPWHSRHDPSSSPVSPHHSPLESLRQTVHGDSPSP
jgi:hypothetical protein